MRNEASWSGWPAAVATPGSINQVITHGQFMIPAGALEPSDSDPCTIESYVFSATNAPTWKVARFDNGVENEAHIPFMWQASAIGTLLSLKYRPIFMIDDLGNGGDISLTGGAFTCKLGTSLNRSAETVNADIVVTRPGTIEVGHGGDNSDDQHAIDLGNVASPDAVQALDLNILNIMIERHGDEVADDFDQPIFLIGMCVQYATDFTNLQVWPVP